MLERMTGRRPGLWIFGLLLASCGDEPSPRLELELPATGPVHPGEAIVLYADRGAALAGLSSASVGGQEASLVAFDPHRVGLVIPALSPGAYDLHAPGYASVPLEVVALPAIGDPLTYVENQLSMIRAISAASGALGDSRLTPFYADALGRLTALQSTVGQPTIDLIAAAVAANGTLIERIKDQPFPSAFPSDAISHWNANAPALIERYVNLAAATTLAVTLGARAVSAGSLGAALAALEYAELQLYDLRVQDPVIFIHPDEISAGQDPLVVGQGSRLLPVQATFRNVSALESESPDETIRKVAEILTELPATVASIDAVIDPDILAPLPLDARMMVRPFLSEELDVAASDPGVQLSLVGSSTLAMLLAAASSCPDDATFLPFDLELTYTKISGAPVSKPFPSTFSCGFLCGFDGAETLSRNDTVATASPGASGNYAICPSGDKDVFRIFPGPMATTLYVGVTYDPLDRGGVPLGVSILDSNGTVVANSAPGTGNIVGISNFPLGSAGPYYVRVEARDAQNAPGPGQNNYSISYFFTFPI